MSYGDFNPQRGGAYPGNIETRCLDILIDLAIKRGANSEAGTAFIADFVPCTSDEARAALRRLESVELVSSKNYRRGLWWMVTEKGRAAHGR